MEFYFSDLTEDAQKRLMEFVGINDPSEANWDADILPLFIYEVEEDAFNDDDDDNE